jgi:hypothetical protein
MTKSKDKKLSVNQVLAVQVVVSFVVIAILTWREDCSSSRSWARSIHGSRHSGSSRPFILLSSPSACRNLFRCAQGPHRGEVDLPQEALADAGAGNEPWRRTLPIVIIALICTASLGHHLRHGVDPRSVTHC